MTSNDSKRFSAIPAPFAESGDRTVVGETASDTVVNQVTGIPGVYSREISTGGKYIQRKDLNGIANLLTLFQYYMQVHSVVRFDQKVCEDIGGYPLGAVLAYVDDSTSPPEMFFIESNNENNTSVPVPGSTIDGGNPADTSKPWHKLTPSWSDIAALDFKVKVVDVNPTNPASDTFYFIRGEGVSF